MLKNNPYIRLMRLERPIGIGLLLMPCLWGVWAGGQSDKLSITLYYSALFMIGSVVMRSAGCVINDYFDRHIDTQVERTKNRPLASGEIKPINALILFAVLSLIGLWVLVQLPMIAISFGLGVFVPIILYPLMKRITYFPQLFLGLIYNIGIVIGYVSTTKIFNPHILWLYACGVLITLAYDTIYAFQDIKDDIKIGVKSSAIAWQHNPKLFIGLCYLLGLFCFAMFFYNNMIKNILLCMIAGGVAFKLYHWDRGDNHKSLILFKQNFYLLCILWFMIILFVGKNAT